MVVIGTGAGGAVVARELADRGYAVVLVEEGKRRKSNDFVGSFVHAHTRTSGTRSRSAPRRSPLLMGKLVGGSTAVNGGTCLRPPPWMLDDAGARTRLGRLVARSDEPRTSIASRPPPGRDPRSQVHRPDRGRRSIAAPSRSAGASEPIPRNAPAARGRASATSAARAARGAASTSRSCRRAREGHAGPHRAHAPTHVLIDRGRAFGVELRATPRGRTFTRPRASSWCSRAAPSRRRCCCSGRASRTRAVEVGKNLSLHPSGGVAGCLRRASSTLARTSRRAT